MSNPAARDAVITAARKAVTAADRAAVTAWLVAVLQALAGLVIAVLTDSNQAHIWLGTGVALIVLAPLEIAVIALLIAHVRLRAIDTLYLTMEEN
jgi:cell division protein FtsW (lipid II flippase)